MSKMAFMFPGQGSQYARMGQGLYAAEPLFALGDEVGELSGVGDVGRERL